MWLAKKKTSVDGTGHPAGNSRKISGTSRGEAPDVPVGAKTLYINIKE
jgi:hypothetical protein